MASGSGSCPHVHPCMPSSSFIPVLAHAWSAQQAGQLPKSALFCVTCCQPISAAAAADGACSQGHTLALLVGPRQNSIVCLSCRASHQAPASLHQAQQLVQLAGKLMQRGIHTGEPAHDPTSQVRTRRRLLASVPDSSNGIAIPCQASLQGFTAAVSPDGLPLGLRGLNNLGNTCFMNSVLQVFVHTPLVRSYFLGDGHSAGHCGRKTSRPCLGCEMDTLFNHMYGGQRQPFSPVDLLYTWWTQSDKMAEYQQQDAHEFYLSALSSLSNAVLVVPTGLPDGDEQAGGMGDGDPQDSQTSGMSWGEGRGAGGACRVSVNGGAPSSGGRPPPSSGGPPSTGQPPNLSGHLNGQLHPLAQPTASQGTSQQAVSQPGQLGSESSFSFGNDSRAQNGAAGTEPGQRGGSQVPPSPNPTQPGGTGGNTSSAMPQATDMSADSYSRAQNGSQAASSTSSMVDAVFGGLLRSDVCCDVCGHVSTAYDPFLDLSLDLLALEPCQGPDSRHCPQWPPGKDPLASATESCSPNGSAILPPPCSQGGPAWLPWEVSDQQRRALRQEPSPCPASELTVEAAESQMHQQGRASMATGDSALEDSMSSPFTGKPRKRPAPSIKAPGPKKGAAARVGKAPARVSEPRATRCGECYPCLNRHLKRACLRNRALREACQAPPENVPGSQSVSPSPCRPISPCPHVGPSASGRLHSPPGVPRARSTSAPTSSTQDPTAPPRKTAGGTGTTKRGPSNAGVNIRAREVSEDPSPSGVSGRAGSTVVEPACSHLDMQTEAWPTGQSQQPVPGVPGSRVMGQATPSVSVGERGAASGPARPAKPLPAGSVRLEDCLSHFIRPEALPASEAWVCSHCKRRQPAVKQMSVRRLPPVLCLHVKRFEHAPGSMHVLRKLQTHLAFPCAEPLDMRPFLTDTLLRCRYGAASAAGIKSEPGCKSDPGVKLEPGIQPELGGQPPSDSLDEQECLYHLFAVVCHKGDITGGHYIVYVRCWGSWFCCDDAWVTLVPEAEVAACQAYMLFLTQAQYATEQWLGRQE